MKMEDTVLGKIAANESTKTKSKPQRGLQLSLFEVKMLKRPFLLNSQSFRCSGVAEST